MRQVTHLELQDENAPKRVAFHPSIVSAESGESLAFDVTKVIDIRKVINPQKVLTSAKPGIAAGPNVIAEVREESIVEKNRSRFEKSVPAVSARAKTYDAPKESLMEELKRVIPNTESRQPVKVTSRYLEECRQAAESGKSDQIDNRYAMSPRKFSVHKIKEARAGPPPKSDDFFNELKQWHQEVALRSVEKPREITITPTVKPAPQPVPYVEEPVQEPTKEPVQEPVQEPVEEPVDEEVKEEEKEAVIEKETEKADQTSKKKKKKFWSFGSRSKNKQKSVEPTEEATPEPEAVEEKLPEPEVQETETPAQEQPSIEERESKLEPEGETAISQKAKAIKKAVEVYNANVMETPELQEPEDLISDLLQADSWLAETFFKKDKATVERIAEAASDESAEEVEESASESSEETEEKEEEVTIETEERTIEETIPSQVESTESSLPSEFGVEKEPWFKKISGYFNEPNATMESGDMSGDYTIDTNPSTDEYTYESGTILTKNTEELEKMVELQVEEWVGKLSTFFNKHGKSGPPISVVNFDKYEMDKYEAFAAASQDQGDQDSIKANEQSWEPARRMYTRKEGEGVDSFDEELREEVDRFLRTQCACLAADFDLDPKPGTEKATMKRMEEYLNQKGMAWYQMATGLFQKSPDGEAPSSESSVGGATGVATATARTVVSEATVKRDNKDPDKPEYDDMMLTLDDGTNVIKMTALMDLYPEESQSLVDSYNNKSKPESSSCIDSKSQKTDNAQKKKSKKTKKTGATLFGSLERKKKNKNKKER